MTKDKLKATGAVRGVFFSLGTTPAVNDPKFDCSKAVIDLFNQTICTGSFNWMNNAEKNNGENLLVVDGTDLAADYEKYVFQRILQNETLIRPK